ncbi:MAG TPA: serine hydrolase [Rhabdaerophilum sp.]|nr:serine hydrolase [Rhabdaerophilum sp.]
MPIRVTFICLAFAVLTGAYAQTPQVFAWPRAGVTDVDIDASVPERLDRELKEKLPRVISLGIVRRGKLVYEYYKEGATAETAVNVASVTKSVLALLVGIALDKGVLKSVDQPITEFFPELATTDVDPKSRDILLRHLLSMSAGWQVDPNDQPPFIALDALKRRVTHAPGSTYQYDNATSHLIGIALSRAAGMSLEDFARVHLFEPLGIVNFNWGKDAQGHTQGWSFLRITLADMLKLGQLVLDRGEWQGRRVVSSLWIREMLTRRNAGGPHTNLPYGYQWYVYHTPDRQHEAVMGIGYGGQFLYVVPALQLVIAKTQTRDQRFSDVAFLREIVMKSLR